MHLAASEGFSELCVMLYEHDPGLLHLRDSWNCTPIMRSIDQVLSSFLCSESAGRAYVQAVLYSVVLLRLLYVSEHNHMIHGASLPAFHTSSCTQR